MPLPEYLYTWPLCISLYIRRTIKRAFITSNFAYCPLVWMLHSRGLNNKINSLHERAQRITDGDKIPSFQSFLEKGNSVSICQRNLQLEKSQPKCLSYTTWFLKYLTIFLNQDLCPTSCRIITALKDGQYILYLMILNLYLIYDQKLGI